MGLRPGTPAACTCSGIAPGDSLCDIKAYLCVCTCLLQLFTLASLITGIIVAAYAKGENRAFGFVAIWLALLLVATSVYGTYVLRRQQSAFAVGRCLEKLWDFGCVGAET